MITTKTLYEWLATLSGETETIAIDDGGLTLVGLSAEEWNSDTAATIFDLARNLGLGATNSP